MCRKNSAGEEAASLAALCHRRRGTRFIPHFAFLAAAYLLNSPDIVITLGALRLRISGREKKQDRSRVSFG